MTFRPTILMDMDSPLADFDDLYFRRCAEREWVMNATYETQTERYASAHILSGAHRRLARSMVEAPGWFSDLPVTAGALEGMEELAEIADVWIATKPMEANPTCRDDKAHWLEEHFGRHWVDRLTITPDKSMIGGHALVDDAPKLEWLAAPRCSWMPVIFERPYNGADSPWGILNHRWSWADGAEALVAKVTKAVMPWTANA